MYGPCCHYKKPGGHSYGTDDAQSWIQCTSTGDFSSLRRDVDRAINNLFKIVTELFPGRTDILLEVDYEEGPSTIQIGACGESGSDKGK